MADNNVYIRYRIYSNNDHLSQTLIFPKDIERVIYGDIHLKSIIDSEGFYKYPQIGDVYMRPVKDNDGIETIMNLNLFLYRGIMLLSFEDLGMNWKCIVNDKQGPFRLMTIGKDTFKNLFLNLDEFIDKHCVALLSDIKIKINFEGYIRGLFMKYMGTDGRPKKLLIKEKWRS